MDETTRRQLEELYPQVLATLQEFLESHGIRGVSAGEVTFEQRPQAALRMRASRCQPGEHEVTRCEPIPGGGFKCKVVCVKQ
jgi:hypothetical protein